MPSETMKLYSVVFKILLKHRLQSLACTDTIAFSSSRFAEVTCHPEESVATANPTFSYSDGVATKDIHIDPITSLSLRIFLSDSSNPSGQPLCHHHQLPLSPPHPPGARSTSDSEGGGAAHAPRCTRFNHVPCRSNCDDFGIKLDDGEVYGGYFSIESGSNRSVRRQLPVILQFHGGAFVSGAIAQQRTIYSTARSRSSVIWPGPDQS